MAVEETGAGVMITGEHIQLYVAMSTCSALALEVNTGLRHPRGSVMEAANAISARLDTEKIRAAVAEAGIRNLSVPTLGLKRTKRGALADLVLFLMVAWAWEPSATATRALGEEMTRTVTRKAERIIAVVRPEGAQ